MYHKFNIVIVVAHIGEARAIFNLEHYEEITTYPFLAFRRHNRILIISGEGRFHAAAAVAFGKVLSERKLIFWLNIGCSGHQNLDLGTIVQVGKIYDAESRRSWFPSTPFKKKIPVVEVHTFDKPMEQYSNATCYDMEASGFMRLAQENVIPEQIAILKIITDNDVHPLQERKFTKIEEQILRRKGLLNLLVDDYEVKAASIADLLQTIELPYWLRTVKFTHSQRQEIKALIRNYKITSENCNPPILKNLSSRSSREIVNELKHQWRAKR